MKKDSGIFKILLESDKVNLYAKFIIAISQMNYYDRYYIPNQYLSNRFKTDLRTVKRIIHDLKINGIIKIQYIGSKRYIKMASYDYIVNFEPFNDDWLNNL